MCFYSIKISAKKHILIAFSQIKKQKKVSTNSFLPQSNMTAFVMIIW